LSEELSTNQKTISYNTAPKLKLEEGKPMTTTVTITHDGPSSHDVLVTPTGSTGLAHQARLHAGESLTSYVYGDGELHIQEISKEQE
jgi:hypothetical protein